MNMAALTAAALAIGPGAAHADPAHAPHDIRTRSYESLRHLPHGAPLTLAGLTIDGQPAELELERFSPLVPDARVVVADANGERAIEAPIVLFRGWMLGDPDSAVVIAVTPWWTQGVVSTAHDTHYISTGPADADAPGQLRVTRASNIPPGPAAPPCGLPPPDGPETARRAERRPSPRSGPPPCRTARVAFDTDFLYTQRFGGDPLKAAAYALLLTGATSEIYRRDLNVRLAVSYLRVWADDSDPYPTTGDSLTQFENHWHVHQINVDRDFAMLLTGRTNLPYGGVARLNSICSDYRGFGVVAYVRGSFPYPVADQHPGNQDLVYLAHEAGHIFGSLHTHDGYHPPIDGCGNGDCSQPVSTIMSYCQLCPGGFTNIQLRLHPRVIEEILDDLDRADCDLTSDQPVALDDQIRVYSDGPRPLNVLANDISTACEPTDLGIAWATPLTPAGGTVEIMPPQPPYPHPWLRYTAPTDYEGPDAVAYTLTNGTSATATLDVLPVLQSVYPGAAVPGIRASYYHVPAPLNIPDLDSLEPFLTEIVPAIDFRPDAPGPFAGSGLDANLAARFDGWYIAPAEGNHLFGLYSDDGARLTIHDQALIDMDNVQDYNGIFRSIELRQGAHPVRIDYFQHDGPAALRAWSAMADPDAGTTIGGGIEILNTRRLRAPDPCPADFDKNGTIDFFDLGKFVSAFSLGDPNTDHFPDGQLTFFDLQTYMDSFIQGCP